MPHDLGALQRAKGDAIRQGNEQAWGLDIHKLSGSIMSGNIGSIKTYTKAGWVEEGRLKKHWLVNGEWFDDVWVACFNPNMKV